MRLGEEIVRALGGAGDPARVQYTVVEGRGGYFQNVRRLLELSETAVVLAGRRGAVRVEGRMLRLGRYGAGDAAILGDIERVVREEER